MEIESKETMILLVEDSATQAFKFRLLLEKEGYQVVLAQTGLDALDAVEANHFDLILLDMQLPDIDGRELRAILRQKAALRYVPMIFITAVFKGLEDIVTGLADGVDEYILKNVPDDEFLARVQLTLSASNSSRQMNRLSRLLLILNQASHLADELVTTESVMVEILSVIKTNFLIDSINLYRLRDARLTLYLSTISNVHKEQTHHLEDDWTSSICARRQKRRVVSGKIKHLFLGDVGFIIALPLVAYGECYGVLELVHKKSILFTEHDLMVLNTVADLLTVGLKREKSSKQNFNLKKVSLKDDPLRKQKKGFIPIEKELLKGDLLLVEDSSLQAMHMKLILNKRGFNVEVVTHGADVLDYLIENTPDIILMDLQLPDIDGRELLVQIKENPLWAGIPIIVITGVFRDVADVVNGLDSGADDYLLKPIHDQAFVARIRATLRTKYVQRQLGHLANMLFVVNQIGQKLVGNFRLDDIFHMATELIQSNLHYCAVQLYTLTDDNNLKSDLYLQASTQSSEFKIDRMESFFSLRQHPYLFEGLDGTEAIAHQFKSDTHFLGHMVKTSSTAPLIVGDKVVGLIELVSDYEEEIDTADLFVLKTLANLISVAIYNARLYGRIGELVDRDSLTNLLNKRAFTAAYKNSWKEMIKEGHDLVVIMLDVDRFKSVNDQYGHVMGDMVLQRIGKVLKEQVDLFNEAHEKKGYIARYGGEEFVLVLPDSVLQDGIEIAEQIRTVCMELLFKSDDGTSFSVTISAGVASALTLQITDSIDLIRFADKGLYRAKAAGRNNVQVVDLEIKS